MNQRIEKINELIKQELSLLFLVDFPGEIITINFLHTTADMLLTKVYVSVASEHQSVYASFKKKEGEYRKALADKLVLRRVPKIEIIKDEMQGSIDRIEEILS
jgi:ribosome-binding factor A